MHFNTSKHLNHNKSMNKRTCNVYSELWSAIRPYRDILNLEQGEHAVDDLTPKTTCFPSRLQGADVVTRNYLSLGEKDEGGGVVDKCAWQAFVLGTELATHHTIRFACSPAQVCTLTRHARMRRYEFAARSQSESLVSHVTGWTIFFEKKGILIMTCG